MTNELLTQFVKYCITIIIMHRVSTFKGRETLSSLSSIKSRTSFETIRRSSFSFKLQVACIGNIRWHHLQQINITLKFQQEQVLCITNDLYINVKFNAREESKCNIIEEFVRQNIQRNTRKNRQMGRNNKKIGVRDSNE